MKREDDVDDPLRPAEGWSYAVLMGLIAWVIGSCILFVLSMKEQKKMEAQVVHATAICRSCHSSQDDFLDSQQAQKSAKKNFRRIRK